MFLNLTFETIGRKPSIAETGIDKIDGLLVLVEILILFLNLPFETIGKYSGRKPHLTRLNECFACVSFRDCNAVFKL